MTFPPYDRIVCSIALVTALSFCSEQLTDGPDARTEQSTQTDPATAPANTLEALLHEHIAILASDEFEGRAPATHGEELTVNYLREQFMKLGVAPGNGDSYFQPVEVTEITAAGAPELTITGVIMPQVSHMEISRSSVPNSRCRSSPYRAAILFLLVTA